MNLASGVPIMSTASTAQTIDSHQHDYDHLLASMQQQFESIGDVPLFLTDATGLWEAFLAGLEPGRQQHYTCNACKSFVLHFGGLVTIDTNGVTSSPLWGLHVPAFDGLDNAFRAMAKIVQKAKVTGVFLAERPMLGIPTVGGWSHFHLQVHPANVNTSELLTAGQRIAEKRAEFKMLVHGLADFPLTDVQQARDLLANGQLYRGEKSLGLADWLVGLHTNRNRVLPNKRACENITWLALARAPAGWAHVRSGVLGTLLEDIQAGLPFFEIKAKWDAKLDATKYMRPQAAPKAGNIAQAEKIMATLRSGGALRRRFALLHELDILWAPPPAQPPAGNPKNSPLFGHLHPDRQAPKEAITTPPVTMTWVKFAATILPNAVKVEYEVVNARKPYCAFVTAVDPNAPPILQWDREERRNPVSTYVYKDGSVPSKWNLRIGWCQVNAFTLQPCNWYGNKMAKEGNVVMAILEGCRDTDHSRSGGFFPEILRSEYNSIRSTLEAYANGALIEGKEAATACGISMSGTKWPSTTFRVTTATGNVSLYKLDRWD